MKALLVEILHIIGLKATVLPNVVRQQKQPRARPWKRGMNPMWFKLNSLLC